jgi:hypothetical protein
MESSMITLEYNKDEIGPLQHVFYPIQAYQEPEEHIVSSLECVDYTNMDKKEGFTCAPAYDYKQAFTTPNTQIDTVVQPKTLEDLENERYLCDTMKSTNDTVWTSFGLYMADGKKVENFMLIE